MIVPSGYEGTSCTPITLINTIEQTNPDYIRNEMIKWALLVAFAAGVITAVILIIVDQSDKRLRNYEIIPKTFNVPVLGVVPSIEEMNIALEAKKKNGEVRK
jgi:capsular polysaccharide biosynthesis protein